MRGWREVYDPYRVHRETPYGLNKLVWLWRESWTQPQLTKMDDVNPALNVVGLLWAPAIDGEGPPPKPTPITEGEK